jgi:hypothetical protein
VLLLRWLGAVGVGREPLWALFLSFCLCIMQVSRWGRGGLKHLCQPALPVQLHKLCSAASQGLCGLHRDGLKAPASAVLLLVLA